MNWKKALKMGICGAATFALIAGGGIANAAAPTQQLPCYKTVTEVFDWGPSVSKLIVNLGSKVSAKEVDKDTFKVYVRRVLPDGALTIAEAMKIKDTIVTLGSEARDDSDLKGYREITAAYVSDENGNPANSGKYVTIEMKVAPDDNLGAALNFDLKTFYNSFVTSEYTITQNKKIGKLKDLVIDNYKGNIRPIVDNFKFGNYKLGAAFGGSLGRGVGYAIFEPEQDGQKHPLIIWLHGGGEGGNSSPALPIMGNKATALAEDNIQKYFGGAYVLAPQCPTVWMEGVTAFADGQPLYEDVLMALFQEIIAANPNIDTSRIYLGGDSNGGYMTLCLVRDYPDYFAAAFPVCEGLADDLISDADLKNLSQTPLWFVAAKTDTTLPPEKYSVPTVKRLQNIGADVHFSYFDDVHDTSGKYFKDDGAAYEYPGHWSWIYVYNDECAENIDGKNVKLMQWLASQMRK